MPRRPSPWFRAQNGAWYAKIGGRQVMLAKGRKAKSEAQARLDAIMVERRKPKAAPTLPVGEVVVRFLQDARARQGRGELAALTVEGYARFLKRFGLDPDIGPLAADAIRPHHVARWLDRHPTWGPTTRHGAATAVKRAFNWARKLGLISADPLTGMERPRPRRREAVVDAAGARKALDGCASPEFRDFLMIVHETGCRPGEARALTAAHLDLDNGRWVMPGKTTAATGRLRTVYLTPEAMAICRRLALRWPVGPIFRNTRGEPWTRTAINTQVRRLRARIGAGPELTVYSMRHLFASDALEREVPIATVAELLGHTSTLMVSRHYGHLSQRHEHLRRAAATVRPKDDPAP